MAVIVVRWPARPWEPARAALPGLLVWRCLPKALALADQVRVSVMGVLADDFMMAIPQLIVLLLKVRNKIPKHDKVSIVPNLDKIRINVPGMVGAIDLSSAAQAQQKTRGVKLDPSWNAST